MEIGLKMGNRDDKPLEKPLCLVERLLALQGATWQKQGEPHRAASLGQGTGCSLVRVTSIGRLTRSQASWWATRSRGFWAFALGLYSGFGLSDVGCRAGWTDDSL